MTAEKKPSLRVLIYQLIKEKRGQKVHIGDIHRFAETQGYLASNGDRRARQLTSEYETKKGVKVPNPYFCPDIKHKTEGKSKVYWWEPESPSENRIVTSDTSHELPQNRRCFSCRNNAIRFYAGKPVCPDHSPVAPSLF